MKFRWLKGGHRQLLVLSLGWGQTCEPWLAKDYGARDVLILYQWDALGALPSLSGYDSYDLLAWSFGVWAAAQLDFGVRFRHAVAVNGTLFPVDDDRGIPVAIFQLTLAGWQVGRSGRSFWKRMGARRPPERDDHSLIQELRFFATRFQAGMLRPHLTYDRAILGTHDRIFTLSNQRRAWQDIPRQELDMPHDLEEQWNTVLKCALENQVDKSRVAKRFERSAETYDAHAVVQRDMAERLLRLLPHPSFERALEFGCGTGIFTRMLKPRCTRLFRNDLVPGDGEDYLCGDIEALALPHDLDLIAGNAVWQWLAQPRRMVWRIAEALKPGGILAVSSFAPGTMGELASLLGVSLDYQKADDFQAMFKEAFKLLDFQEYETVLNFHTPLEVLKHLKHTGVTAAGGQFTWTRDRLAEFDREYRRRFPELTLTYRPRLLLARKED